MHAVYKNQSNSSRDVSEADDEIDLSTDFVVQ